MRRRSAGTRKWMKTAGPFRSERCCHVALPPARLVPPPPPFGTDPLRTSFDITPSALVWQLPDSFSTGRRRFTVGVVDHGRFGSVGWSVARLTRRCAAVRGRLAACSRQCSHDERGRERGRALHEGTVLALAPVFAG